MIEKFVSSVDKEKAVAVFGNELIEAYHNDFSLYDLRILNFVVSLISPADEEFKLYKVPVKVLEEFIDVNTDVYKIVEKTIRDLVRKEIIIRKDNELIVANVFSVAKYRKGAGYFEIALNEILKPFLLKLKERFTKLSLKHSLHLTSAYSFRIYELLKQYENTGYRVDDITELRKMLGIKEHEYTRFTNFEMRVLKTAVEEINRKTDLIISYKKKKIGREIKQIIWYISKQGQEEAINQEAIVSQKEVLKKEKIDAVLRYIGKNNVHLTYIHNEDIDISAMQSFNNAFYLRVISKKHIYVLCADEQEATEFIEVFGKPSKIEKFPIDMGTENTGFSRFAMFEHEGFSKFSTFAMALFNNYEFLNNFYDYLLRRGLFG